MRIFLLDIVMGLSLVAMILALMIGFIVFRGRREAGPLFLLISSAIGSTGPIFFLLDQTQILSSGPALHFGPILIWIIGVILSRFFWRKGG